MLLRGIGTWGGEIYQNYGTPLEFAAHLHDAMSSLQPVQVVVRHAHSLSQALLLAVYQPSAEGVICPGVNNGEPWPMDLVQI